MESPKKILLVDDEIEVIDSLNNILQKKSYEVFTATKGSKALELAQEYRPDIIILDIVMPGLLGGEVANKLSENPATANIPIIFVSGLNTKEDEKIMQENSGNYHTLAKPITPEELLNAIEKVLGN